MMHSRRLRAGRLGEMLEEKASPSYSGVAPRHLEGTMVRSLGALALLTAVFLPGIAEAQRGVPINIESVPPGATVYLNATTAPPLGATPLANVRVPAGSHTFIFQLANHEEARLLVTVRRRRETFRAVLRALGTVEISAGNDASRGGNVSVDGRPVGQLGAMPVRVTDLQPGRHQVRVERDGYRTFEQWVDVGGGQMVRIAALLERAAPDTGQVLVSGPPGAHVFLDGRDVGTTPTVLDDVPVGAHTVEIRVDGQQPYSTQVAVLAGQRATVMMPVRSGGTLRVIASAMGAVISIDGEVIGPSPAVREGLAPGEHIVEASAEGYEPARQTVTVDSGQQRVVSIDLQRIQGSPGRIMVTSDVPGSDVIIDGEQRGQAPVVFTPEPGPHAIVVRAEGHQEYSTTCETAPGSNCEVTATLRAQQVRVSVQVQPGLRGAQLYVDEELRGPVPFDGTLPSGSHVIVVRADGYEEYREQVLLTPSADVRAFSLSLARTRTGPSDEELADLAEREERARGAAVTHSAAPLPVNQASIDVSLGWPYLAEIRLNVGVLEFLDAGFAIRSFGRLTEFEGRLRAGFRPVELVGIGGQVRFGGGIGPELGFRRPLTYTDEMDVEGRPWSDVAFGDRQSTRPTTVDDSMEFSHPVNSAFFSLEFDASLHFSEQGAFTIWLAMDVSSDEYPGHPLNSGAYLDYAPNAVAASDIYCEPVTDPRTQLRCPREDFARARLGGSLELVLARNWNLWFLLEGILSSQPRRIMGNLIGIQTNDTQFYFRLGTTYKF
jgi:hypothetical protein